MNDPFSWDLIDSFDNENCLVAQKGRTIPLVFSFYQDAVVAFGSKFVKVDLFL